MNKRTKLNNIFPKPILKSLHQIMNIPIKEVRNSVLLGFCNHEQLEPILKKHNIKPMFLYYILINT